MTTEPSVGDDDALDHDDQCLHIHIDSIDPTGR